MPDPNQWLPRGGRAPGQPPVVYAQVSRLQAVPTSFTDSLYVVIPYDPDHAIEITNWPVIHGATLPAAGADVALVCDDEHNWRVVWWNGMETGTFPDPVTGAAWITASLLNSWANTGSGFETAAYLKDALGFVHLKGVVRSGASNTVAFVLPAGFRPGAKTINPGGDGGSPTQWSIVVIDTSGNVTVQWSTTSVNVGMSGITFLAEN